MGLEYRGEHSRLEPPCVQFRIGRFDTLGLKMASDVVSPVAVAHVGSGGGEIWQIAKHLPRSQTVSGKADLVAVAADASPAMVDHRAAGIYSLISRLADHIVEEGVVQPECVVKSLHVLAELPLLPVEPPEVNSLTLERTDHGIEICVRPVDVIHPERYRSLAAVRIDVTLRAVIFIRP